MLVGGSDLMVKSKFQTAEQRLVGFALTVLQEKDKEFEGYKEDDF